MIISYYNRMVSLQNTGMSNDSITFFCFFSFFFFNNAFALDKSNVGTYAAINKDGSVSDTLISVSRSSDRWFFSVMSDDGSWDTCPDTPENCSFKKPTYNDLKLHFTQSFLDKYTPDCIYSNVWVFCRLKEVDGNAYIIATQVTPEPTMVWLKKISGNPKDGRGKISKPSSHSTISPLEIENANDIPENEESRIIDTYHNTRLDIPQDAQVVPITQLQDTKRVEAIILSNTLNSDSPRLLQVKDEINESVEIKKQHSFVNRVGNILNLSAGGVKYQFQDWDDRKSAELNHVEGDVQSFKYAGLLPGFPFHHIERYSNHDGPLPIFIHQRYPLALSFVLSDDLVSIAASGERILQIANRMNPPAAVAVTSIASGQYQLELLCRADGEFTPQFKGWGHQDSKNHSSTAVESSDDFSMVLLSPTNPGKAPINYQTFVLQFSYRDNHWSIASNDPQKLQDQTGFRCWTAPEEAKSEGKSAKAVEEAIEEQDDSNTPQITSEESKEINAALFNDKTQLSVSDLATVLKALDVRLAKMDGKSGFINDQCEMPFSLKGELARKAQYKQDEVWVTGGSTCTSGSTRQSIWLFLRDDEGKLQANLGIPATGAEVTKESYRDHYDISIGVKGSCEAIWRWDGDKYEWYKNIPSASGGCNAK
ncbi:conserved hypothetical protein [Enterobacterales bacterium 8AC]|nr:conserved hypothetical protein [Enterobacterales bacterium 8AC]